MNIYLIKELRGYFMMKNKIREVRGLAFGYRNFSAEHDPIYCMYRVVFTDHTGVYQSYENGRAVRFPSQERAEQYAQRFNDLYVVKPEIGLENYVKLARTKY